jgi:hypothetical protein
MSAARQLSRLISSPPQITASQAKGILMLIRRRFKHRSLSNDDAENKEGPDDVVQPFAG